jgi:hypothetical protein
MANLLALRFRVPGFEFRVSGYENRARRFPDRSTIPAFCTKQKYQRLVIASRQSLS